MGRILDPNTLRDRFRGVLLGVAVGDALGAPLEFQPASSPQALVREMIGGGWQQLAPGEWTDDTQMTLCVVESLLVKRVFDPDDIARRFVAWLQSHPKDIGLHTRRVLQDIADGMHWEAASLDAYHADPENAPNGSLMRCAPLSLFFYRHPEYIAELSPVLSRITHAHPDCEWSCVFANVLLTCLLQGMGAAEAVDFAYEALTDAGDELKERIGRAMESECDTLSTGWVLDTLEVALWCFLHTSDFESAVVTAVNRGADSDTVGAVVGAMAGARYGMTAIPPRWLTVLKNGDLLQRYADGLFDLAMADS